MDIRKRRYLYHFGLLTLYDLSRVLEAKDMALKMRRIHDALQGEVAQKKTKLTEMKRNVEERASQVLLLLLLLLYASLCGFACVDVLKMFVESVLHDSALICHYPSRKPRVGWRDTTPSFVQST